MSKPTICSINIGKAETFFYQDKEITSAIIKKQVEKPIFLSKLHLDGDEQVNQIHHGGVDKAVCVYPFEHYSHWGEMINQKLSYGAFGENVTITNMTEAEVCIGDIYQIGEAVVQVSQPRQPCFKLAARYRKPELPKLIEDIGYTGYYFRVLEEGMISTEAKVSVVEKHPLQVSVHFANHSMYHDKENKKAAEQILSVTALSESWRQMLTNRI